MNTPLLSDAALAADALRRGGLVAFPTETVYGLGADARNADAVANVFAAKGRPTDNPLIVHLADAADASDLAVVSTTARRLMDAFWPGPLTLVVPLRADAGLAVAVTAGLGTVGLRVPNLPEARAFLAACGVPVAAPSANRSGRPSPTDAHAVLLDLDGRIDAVLDGPPATAGLESTVVDVTQGIPVVLRDGAVTLADLRRVVPETVRAARGSELARRSPGTRHRHYAPRTRIVAVEPNAAVPHVHSPAGWLGLVPPDDPSPFAQIWTFATVPDYAHALFRTFREADALGLEALVCRLPPDQSETLAHALRDRILRAAE
ncbi:MAG: threonylcarbamoyl-AMP synthase [Bacteroidetes bacterium]|nr:threonylcarbamoyl-AMP synthase [Bacteroidota bacterium]